MAVAALKHGKTRQLFVACLACVAEDIILLQCFNDATLKFGVIGSMNKKQQLEGRRGCKIVFI